MFKEQHCLSLTLAIIGGILCWYSLVLLTNPHNIYTVKREQYKGLFFALMISTSVFFQDFFTINNR